MQRIQRGTVATVAGFFLMALVSARAAEIDKFLPNETEGVTSINVRQLLDSAVIKKVGVDHIKSMLATTDAQKVFDQVGFDPLKDLNSLTFASAGGADGDKFVVIFHGTFDVEKCHAKAEAVAKSMDVKLTIHKLGDYKVYEAAVPNMPKPLFVAVLDKGTVVAASTKELALEALDKEAGKKQASVKKDVQELVEKTDTKQSFWLAGLLSDQLAKSPLAADEKVKDVLEKIASLRGGVNLTDDLKIEFVLGAKSATAAKDLSEVIKQGISAGKDFVNLFGANDKRFAPVVELLESVKVTLDGSGVTLKAQIKKSTIDKTIDKGA